MTFGGWRSNWLDARRTTAALIPLALLATACAATGATGDGSSENGAPPAEEFVIRYAAPTATGSSFQQTSEWYFNEVSERSDGRIRFEGNFNSSLVGAGEALQAMQDGRIDMMYWGASYGPGNAPLFEVTGVPFVSRNEYAVVWTLSQMYEENELFKKEFDSLGIKPVFFHFNGSGQLFSSEPNESVSDLAGKRFRVTGLAGEAIAAAGGEAVGTEPAEIYESIQRDILDGTLFGLESGVGFGTHEVAPHILESGMGVYFEAGEFVSLELWDSLPEELQDIMTEVGSEVNATVGPEFLSQVSADDCETFLEAPDSSYTVFDDEDIAEWRNQTQDAIKQDWAESAAERKGISVDEVHEWFDEYSALIDTNGEAATEAGHVPNWRACSDRFEEQ